MNIVQARCPFCKNMLRIPADWLERPMRCKHCKNIFQAKDRAPQPAIAESGGFPMGPASEPAPAAAGFGLNDQPAYYPPMPAPSYAPAGYPPAPYPPQPYAPAPYPPQYPPAGYGPPSGYAPPPAAGGFDNIDAGSQDGGDTMVAKPRARRAGNNNGALIGWLVVGGLFLATVAVLGAVLPGVLRSVNETEKPAPHAKIDPKQKSEGRDRSRKDSIARSSRTQRTVEKLRSPSRRRSEAAPA